MLGCVVREFVLQRSRFSPEVVQATRDAILGSPLLARSPLYGSFRATRGFAAIFRRDGLKQLQARLPEMSRFLEEILSDAQRDALVRWPTRLFQRAPLTNAYYLNVLAVPRGAKVDRHVDATLRTPSGDPEALPSRVSVLYLQVPEARGGQLRLHAGERHIADVTPREGALLHFRGDLAHEVLPFESEDPNALRVSLVCEQYALGADALARLEPFRLQSKAAFDAHLLDHERRGG